MTTFRTACARVLAAAALVFLALWNSAGAADLGQLDEALKRVASYQYGQDFAPLAQVLECVRSTKSDPAFAASVESRLIAFLRSPASLEGKKFVCEQLSLIGTKAAAPVLAELLPATETSDMARYALERISAPEAGMALSTALAKAGGKQRIGIVTSLGRRREGSAATLIAPLILSNDPATSLAAVNALGQIGDETALKALAEARAKVAGSLRDQVSDAYLRCLEQVAKEGDRNRALSGYQELIDPAEPVMIRVAALRGLTALQGSKAIETLSKALRSDNTELQAAGIQLLGELPDPEATRSLVQAYPSLGETGRVRLLSALVTTADSAVGPLLEEALKDKSAEVRVAALEGIGKIGSAAFVPRLARIAAESDDPERTAAQLSLYRLAAEGADQAVQENLGKTSGKVKVELIKAVGERRIEAAADELLKTAADRDRTISRESRRALRDTAQPSHVPALLSLLKDAATVSERAELESALVATLKRYEMQGVDPVMSAQASAGKAEYRASLLTVLGRAGYEQALGLLRSALRDKESAIQRAAILGLTDWPTPEPLPDLLETATSAPVKAHQILALRGYVRLVGLPTKRPRAESVRMLQEGLRVARQDEERKAILSLLPRFASPEALSLAESLQGSSVSEEARLAVERIKISMEN